MQFENREELFKFERERKEYYDDWFWKTKTTIGFYKQWFLEIFNPKHRALKKKYDSYLGGWYKDGNIIYTTCTSCLSDVSFEPGTIVYEIANGDELAWKGIYVGSNLQIM